MLGLLVIDRATMVIEEIFRNACYGYQVGMGRGGEDRERRFC